MPRSHDKQKYFIGWRGESRGDYINLWNFILPPFLSDLAANKRLPLRSASGRVFRYTSTYIDQRQQLRKHMQLHNLTRASCALPEMQNLSDETL
jgi:hypothetical protein